MKIKRNIIIIIILYAMILLVSTFLVVFSKKEYSSSTSKNEIPSYIAIYLEDSVGSGTYTYSDLTSWPSVTSYTYNKTKSTCKNGALLLHNIVDNSVEAKLLGSDSCKIYYDANGELNTYIKSLDNIEQDGDTWIVRKANNGYYYAGSDPHNYICFGTDDKQTCLDDQDTYLYRIIGTEKIGYDASKTISDTTEPTNSEYSTKIVSTAYQEASTNGSIYISNHTAYTSLNSTFYESLSNAQKNLIVNAYWIGGYLAYSSYLNYFKNGMYSYSYSVSNKHNLYNSYGYVGLVYPYDLGYTIYEGDNFYFDTGKNTSTHAANQWLATGTPELTLLSSNTSTPIIFNSDKYVSQGSGNYVYRAAMYLNPDVQIVSGTGTADDPFMIKRADYSTTADVINNSMVKETDINAYMFQGLDVNNYACFGTTDQEECTTAVDAKNYTKYLYRIVGYFPTEYATNGVNVDGYDYLFKLQKQDRYYRGSGTTITYAFDSAGGSYYPESTLYNELNITYLNQYDETWQNHIANAKWYLGTVGNSTVTADLYAKEHGTNSEVNTFICKASLLYPSDVIYSVPSSKYSRTASIYNTSTSSALCTGTSNTTCNSYLMKTYSTTTYLLNPSDYNDENSTCDSEESCINKIYSRHIRGAISTTKLIIYPAIYLTADAYIVSGSGTADDPYIFGFNS